MSIASQLFLEAIAPLFEGIFLIQMRKFNMKNTVKNITASLAVIMALGLSAGAYATESTTETMTNTAITAPVTTKTNLNTADAQAIAGKVKGIGLKRAEAIVAYRTEHGAYKSMDDLTNVKGITENFIKTHLDALNQAFTLS